MKILRNPAIFKRFSCISQQWVRVIHRAFPCKRPAFPEPHATRPAFSGGPILYIPPQEHFHFHPGVVIMPDAVIAQKGPYPVEVEAGKTYFWCACGRSANQPFCDGSHKGTEFTPMKYEATESETVYFCGCKHTSSGCMCDGTHGTL
jgi:CDGSH iron-sulfur domain-containing protein 3